MLNNINAKLNETNAKLNSLGTKAGASIAPSMQKVANSVAPASRSIEQFTANLAMNSQRLRTFGYLASSAVTVPLVMMGKTALNTAKDFEFSLVKIQGLVGMTSDEVARFRDEILRMAPELGSTPYKLAETLYYVTSAGFKDAGDAMQIVETAAKATRAGLGETEAIAKLLVFAMNAYKKEGLTATRVADVFVAAIREGAIEAEGFASSMQSVLPIASALGVGIEEVAGFMAAMSLQGATAANSATYLRGMLNSLLKIKPGTDAAKGLGKLGITAEELMHKLQGPQGLMGVLMEIKALSEKTTGNVFLKSIFKDIRGLTGVLSSTGQNLEANQEILKKVANAYGDLERAGTAATGAIETRMNVIKATASKAWGIIGQGIAKELIPMLDSLVTKLNEIAVWFDNLSDGSKKFIVNAGLLAAALGPLTLGLSLLGYTITGVINGLNLFTKVLSAGSKATPWLLVGTAIITAVSAFSKYKKKVEETAKANSSLNKELVSINGELRKLKNLTETDMSAMTGNQLWDARAAAHKAYKEARQEMRTIGAKAGLSESEMAKGLGPNDKKGLLKQLFTTNYTKAYNNATDNAMEAKKAFEQLDAAFVKWSNNFGTGTSMLVEGADSMADITEEIEKQESALEKLVKQYEAESKYIDMMERLSQGGKRFEFDVDTTKLELAQQQLEDFVKEISQLGDTELLTALASPANLLGMMYSNIFEGLIQQVEKYKKIIKNRTEGQELQLLQMEADAFGGLAGKIEVVNYQLQATQKTLRDLLKRRIAGELISDDDIKGIVDNINEYKNALVDLKIQQDMTFAMDMYKVVKNTENSMNLLSAAISAVQEKLRNLSENGLGGSEEFAALSGILGTLKSAQVGVDILSGAFSSLFNDIIEGGSTFAQMMEKIIKGVLQQLAELLAKFIAVQIIMAVLAPGSKAATGVIGGIMGGIMGGIPLAKGGVVPSGYSNDTYPALLSSGEAVLPKALTDTLFQSKSGGNSEVYFRIKDDYLEGMQKRTAIKRSLY
jgi:TP901 family phage tail tape measure protein